MKKKILIISAIIISVLIIGRLITNYIDGGRVSTGHEPKCTIKIINEDGNKVTYHAIPV